MMINSKERIAALEMLSIMDTLPEEDYDNITKIASEICDTPVAYVSFLDDKRQWYKSKQGMDIQETTLDDALCLHAINNPQEIIVVEDLRENKTYSDNPYVKGSPNVVFYAAVPLIAGEGHAIGTLCVLDLEKKALTDRQIDTLKVLGRQVMILLELRKNNLELKRRTEVLEIFQTSAKNEILSATKNIKSLSNLLSDFNQLDERSEALIDLILESNKGLGDLIKDL